MIHSVMMTPRFNILSFHLFKGESFCSLIFHIYSRFLIFVYLEIEKDSKLVSRVLCSCSYEKDACHLSAACVATGLYRSTLQLRRAAFSFCSLVYMNFQLPECTALMLPPTW